MKILMFLPGYLTIEKNGKKKSEANEFIILEKPDSAPVKLSEQ